MSSSRNETVSTDALANLSPQVLQELRALHARIMQQAESELASSTSEARGKFCVRSSTGEYVPLVPSIAVPRLMGLPQSLTYDEVRAQAWNVVEGQYNHDAPTRYVLEPSSSPNEDQTASSKVSESDSVVPKAVPSPPITPPRPADLDQPSTAVADRYSQERKRSHDRKVSNFQQLVRDSADQRRSKGLPASDAEEPPETSALSAAPQIEEMASAHIVPQELEPWKMELLKKHAALVGIPPWNKPHEWAPLPAKKQYCTYWLRHGECDYSQRTCKYNHYFAPKWVWMAEIGFRELPRWFTEAYPKATSVINEILGDKPWEQEARRQISKLDSSQLARLNRQNRAPLQAFAPPAVFRGSQLQAHYNDLRNPAALLRSRSHPTGKQAQPQLRKVEGTGSRPDTTLYGSKYAPMARQAKGQKRGRNSRRLASREVPHGRLDQASLSRLLDEAEYDQPLCSADDEEELGPDDSCSEISSLIKFSTTAPSAASSHAQASRNPAPLMPSPVHPRMFTDREALRNAPMLAEVEAKNEAAAQAARGYAQDGKAPLTGPQRLQREVMENASKNEKAFVLLPSNSKQSPEGSDASKGSSSPTQASGHGSRGRGRRRGRKHWGKKTSDEQARAQAGKSPTVEPPAASTAAPVPRADNADDRPQEGLSRSGSGSAGLGGSATGSSETKLKPIGAERSGA